MPGRAVIASLMALALGVLLAVAAGGAGAGTASARAAVTTTGEAPVARVPGTLPRRVRQRNGLLRTSVRLRGSAGTAALSGRVRPLSPAQRRRFARRLAGVNPPASGPVSERDTLVPPLGAASDAADATALGSGGAASALAVGDITVFRNTRVAYGTLDGAQTSNVAEPTVANDRNGLLYTSNWLSRVSSDNGLTWRNGIDPFAIWASLPQTPQTAPGFCCDQSAHAVDHADGSMVFWVMQGLVAETDNPPGNALVLSVFRGKDDLIDAAGVDDFCAYPLVASDFGLSGNDNFDFPQVSTTDRYLYISVNVGKGKQKNTSYALVMRFSLDDLQDGDCLADPVAWSDTRTKENLIPVQDAEDTMFFATHTRTADVFKGDQLRIYSIRDTSGTMETKNVNITDFAPVGKDQECEVQALNICGKADGRVITGFQAGDTVGWLWTAAQDGNHPFPYVRVAAFDDDTLALVGERDIFNNAFALNYPSVGVNSQDDVGLTLYQMGGNALPKLWATVVDDPRTWNGDLPFRIVDSSNALPSTGEWGDFAKVFPYDNCDRTFAAGAWVIEDAGDLGADHRFVWFGKEGDGCVDLAATNIVWLQTDLTDTDGIQRGESIQISATFQNSGSATSPGATFRFYLSPNAKAGPNDVAIIQQLGIVGLAPGADVTTIPLPSLPIPETLAFRDGEYYVVACVDEEHAIEEITDTNNCIVDERPVVIAGGPFAGQVQERDLGDFAMTAANALHLVSGTGGGSTSSFRGQVNPGAILEADEVLTLTASASRSTAPPVRYALSRAPLPGDDDVVTLGSRRVGAVTRTRRGGRTTYRSTRRLTVPRTIAPGRWYLVTCLAPGAGREDRRTANDCRVRRAPILVTGTRRARVARARVPDRR